MYNQSALIDNSLLQKRIDANNKANEIFSLIADKPWNTLPSATTIDINYSPVDLTITFDLNKEDTPLAEHEVIFSTIPDKVRIYHKERGASSDSFAPDWDGNKLEELLGRYIGSREEDFQSSLQIFKSESLGGRSMQFYSTVDGYKIRWVVLLSNEAYEKAINSTSHRTTFSNGDSTRI